MSLIAAAICPQAPALVPEVGIGIASELAEVRDAALASLRGVLDASPDRVVILGDGGDGSDESAGGTFRVFGPELHAGGPDRVLPPALTVGAWMLDSAGWTGPRTYSSTLDASGSERIGVLVLADGSARHRLLAPEWEDVEGRSFDAAVAKALESGDAAALASLDLEAAREFRAAGIAGLVALGETCKDARVDTQLRYDGAPFDVGYWVADWQITGSR